MKPYISKNMELRTTAKNDFRKNFFKMMNNSVFGKTMENIRKRKDIKLVINYKRRNYLVSESNYGTTYYKMLPGKSTDTRNE